MTAASASARVIVISNASSGYSVNVEPAAGCANFGHVINDREYAQAYARGLAVSTGWAIRDESAAPANAGAADRRFIILEQLNHAQWHAFDPDTGWASGVANWASAVSDALWAGLLTSSGVESVDLGHNRLILLEPTVLA